MLRNMYLTRQYIQVLVHNDHSLEITKSLIYTNRNDVINRKKLFRYTDAHHIMTGKGNRITKS